MLETSVTALENELVRATTAADEATQLRQV
jgi:hypothetical protein